MKVEIPEVWANLFLQQIPAFHQTDLDLEVIYSSRTSKITAEVSFRVRGMQVVTQVPDYIFVKL